MDFHSGIEGSDFAIEERQEGRARLFKLLILALILIAIAIGVFAAFKYFGGVEEKAKDDQSAPNVTVVAPGRGTVEGMITATGTLAARREMPVGVAGEGGRVVAVPVDAGDWVQAGQVLAVIDRSVQNQQVYSAAAQIAVAQADSQLAQANLSRALKLVERGFVSKADIDRMTAARDGAVARVRAAQAQVDELRARNARLNVVAPASGLVLARNVEPGQIVGGGGPLFLIAKDGEMEMQAKLGEADLAKVAIGTEATVTPTGISKAFTGQIWQIAPMIDANSRQGTARIALGYASELRPGGFATANIKSGTIVATLLPESAVLSDAKGSFVYIVGEDNKVKRRDIKIGLITAKGIAISSGLSGTERVVLRAGGFLAEDESVIPRLAKTSTED